jgi:hypothetical protein
MRVGQVVEAAIQAVTWLVHWRAERPRLAGVLGKCALIGWYDCTYTGSVLQFVHLD